MKFESKQARGLLKLFELELGPRVGPVYQHSNRRGFGNELTS